MNISLSSRLTKNFKYSKILLPFSNIGLKAIQLVGCKLSRVVSFFRIDLIAARLFKLCAVAAIYYFLNAVNRQKILSGKLVNRHAAVVLPADGVISFGVFLTRAAAFTPFGLVRLCRYVDKLSVDIFLYLANQLIWQNISRVFVRQNKSFPS